MAQVNNSSGLPEKAQIAADARTLMRQALKGSLASLDPPDGAPYASLITLATDPAGAPVFLISTLARHTRNLAADPRGSILIDGTGPLADPLQGARLTLSGKAEKLPGEAVRQRFLARQKEAAFYAGFPDFSFWRLKIQSAHFIGGFGRIVDLEPGDLLISLDGAEALIEAEADIVAHMNEDHAEAVALYGRVLAGGEPGPWRMTGLDPEGCDIVLKDNGAEPAQSPAQARRIAFGGRVLRPADARRELARLAKEARGKDRPGKDRLGKDPLGKDPLGKNRPGNSEL